MKIFSIILLLLLLIPSISADGRPSYQPKIWINESQIKPHDVFEIKIKFYGGGNITKNKIIVSSDMDIVLIGFKDILPNSNYTNPFNDSRTIMAQFDNRIFYDKRYPPFSTVEINSLGIKALAKNPGDYKVTVYLIYSDIDGNNYINKETTEIHITKWTERNDVAILVWSIFIVSIISLIWKLIRYGFSRRKKKKRITTT